MLSGPCHNDANKASDLLTMIVSDNDTMKEKVIDSDADMSVTISIVSCVNLFITEKGCATNENQRKKNLIEACFHQSDCIRNNLLKSFNLSKKSCNAHATGTERNVKTRVDCTKDIAKERIDLCVHSDVGTHM